MTFRPPYHALALGMTVLYVLGATNLEAQFPGNRAAKRAPAPAARYPTRNPAAAHALPPIARVVTPESEPNDSLSQADQFTLGDTVSAAINPSGDVDYFITTLSAGTRVELDIDAQVNGSSLDAIMALFDSVGNVLAFSDDADGLDSRISYNIVTAGRYYVGVADYWSGGGSTHTYILKSRALQPGPGDTPTLFATGLTFPLGVAATATGELIVADADSTGSVRRIPAAGGAAVRLATVRQPSDVVIDGLGDILVSGVDSSNRGAIFRLSAGGGAPSVFARLPVASSPGALTVGPDGDVWAYAYYGILLRFDPTGQLKDSINVDSFVADMAFSPAGILTLTDGYDNVAQLVGRGLNTVVTTAPYIEGIAFDRDGYLYVANGYQGEVQLYNSSFQQVGEVFARNNLGGPIFVAFGRSNAGAMTSRLFAAQAGYNLPQNLWGTVVELNVSGIRAPGFRVGIDLLRVANGGTRAGIMGAEFADTLRLSGASPGTATWSLAGGSLPSGITLGVNGVISGVFQELGADTARVRVDAGGQFGYATLIFTVTEPQLTTAQITNHLFGADLLTPALARYLDLQGNANGRTDVGDFRAWLRDRNQLPTSLMHQPTAPAAGEGRPRP
ncbi:MAG TPA: pre-peptidase C-terminal domain-containing protein [Gemmatimonadales bacterium]|nr:pre-peptidase C-terminal domain-containing protein [Gemmatimonadales bacterium]